MVRRWVCGVVVIMVVFGSLGWPAPVMAKQPADYYVAEFLLGEVGLVVSGFLGLVTGAAISSVGCNNPECSLGSLVSASVGGIIAGGIGTGLGVVLVGQANGVAGNVGGAYVGSFLGIAAGLGIGTMLAQVAPTLSLVALATPAAFAVIGYNIGAKMKDTGQPAVLPWTLDLPVLSLEW